MAIYYEFRFGPKNLIFTTYLNLQNNAMNLEIGGVIPGGVIIPLNRYVLYSMFIYSTLNTTLWWGQLPQFQAFPDVGTKEIINSVLEVLV